MSMAVRTILPIVAMLECKVLLIRKLAHQRSRSTSLGINGGVEGNKAVQFANRAKSRLMMGEMNETYEIAPAIIKCEGEQVRKGDGKQITSCYTCIHFGVGLTCSSWLSIRVL